MKKILSVGVISITLFFSGPAINLPGGQDIPIAGTIYISGFCPTALVYAGVTHYWLDTSGSMNRESRIENAKEVLISEIQKAKPGDILYIGSFDTNERLIGRLAVDESGSADEKAEIIVKLQNLRATGRWTNLDEPLQASKSNMLDDRVPGKIVILSDGISDPSPDHKAMDLHRIAQIIPQTLGWSLYLVGLSQDLEGIFGLKPSASEPIAAANYPHVKGISVVDFTHDKIAEAVESVKVDSQKAPVVKPSTMEQKAAVPLPWFMFLGAVLLSAIGGGLPLVFKKNRSKKKHEIVFEVQGPGGESREVRFTLLESKRKTVGPKGEIVVDSGDAELPPVIFTIEFSKGSLLLLPQERMSVNGKIVADTTAVLFGDIIRVRETVTILIKEGGNDDDK